MAKSKPVSKPVDMGTKKCKGCGVAMKAAAVKCPACGMPMPPAKTSSPSKKPALVISIGVGKKPAKGGGKAAKGGKPRWGGPTGSDSDYA